MSAVPDLPATGTPPTGSGIAAGWELYGLGLLLLCVAGWVDAVGFLHWGGLFVSFMSGNTTQLGVYGAERAPAGAITALSAIGVFVLGVIVGEALSVPIGKWHRTVILAIETVLLGGATWLSHRDTGTPVTLLLGFAMGLQNAAIHRAERIGMALTYVTGTLVHFGRSVGAALVGRGGWRAAATYAGLWLSLLAGAAAGGFAAHWSEALAIGLACALMAVATILSRVLGADPHA